MNTVELCLYTITSEAEICSQLALVNCGNFSSPPLLPLLGMAGGKYRSFLIHVKAVNDRGTEEICNGGIRPVVRIPSLKPQANKGHSLASLLAKVAAGKVRNS